MESAWLETLYSQREMHPEDVSDVLALPSFEQKLKQVEQHFDCPFSALDLTIQRAVTFKRLGQLIQILKVNPVWAERLSGVDGTTLTKQQWCDIPLLERDDLFNWYMGKRTGMVVPLSQGHFQVIASGGTSGGLPIETVYSITELRDTYARSGQFFDQHILPLYFTDNALPKWMVTTLSDYQMWSSGSMLGGVLQNIPSFNFVHAGPMSDRTYRHLMSFEGDKAMLGMSREIEALAPLGEALPQADRDKFRLAFYGSGVLSHGAKAKLQDVYPNLQILSYFASNQAEAIGISRTPDGALLSVPGLHFIEIVDSRGYPVKVGEEGELVITRLHANEAPLLRMRLGDKMVRQPDFFDTSLQTEQFEFAGRSGDIIHLGETHYSAHRALAEISSALQAMLGQSIIERCIELQFCNDRTEKVLTLILRFDSSISTIFPNSLTNEQIRSIFVSALGKSLPLYDQTEAQLSALAATSYRFELAVVDKQSELFYRTAVNKTPLIRDRI